MRSIVILAVLVAYSGILCHSCNKNSLEGMIVAVKYASGSDLSCEGAAIIALDTEKSDNKPVVISEDFHAACAPSVSYDGRYLLFQGKKGDEAPWQIWVRDLIRNSISRVTDLPENCTHPVYLPNGMIVFSRSGHVKEKEVSALFKCNMDGSGLQQLTFHPHLDVAPSILQDGRILFISSQQYPAIKKPLFQVMLPDGTKSELFYKGSSDSFPVCRGIESEEGFIYFIESGSSNQGSSTLVAVNQNRPLNSRMDLSEGLEGEFHSVIPLGPHRCLVAYRSTSLEPFALYEFDTREGKIIDLVYQGDSHVTDPVWIGAMKERPRRLPSAVNPDEPTGLLLSQDINHSIVPVNGSVRADTSASKIRVMGLEGLLGEAVVKEDGSLYLKIDADIPFRMITLNDQGEQVRGPSGWIWLRPNERRGCVGCHADPELAPENIQPLAVRHPPVIISSDMKEKSNL